MGRKGAAASGSVKAGKIERKSLANRRRDQSRRVASAGIRRNISGAWHRVKAQPEKPAYRKLSSAT